MASADRPRGAAGPADSATSSGADPGARGGVAGSCQGCGPRPQKGKQRAQAEPMLPQLDLPADGGPVLQQQKTVVAVPAPQQSSGREKMAQIDFFEAVFADRGTGNFSRYSNSFELYDLAPKYVPGKQDRMAEASVAGVDGRQRRLPIHRQTFSFHGAMMTVEITPARLIDKEGREYDRLPGRREQIVEDALRQLSIEMKSTKREGKFIGTSFRIRDLRRKLEEPVRNKKGEKVEETTGHTLSNAEIKEALLVLNKANLTILLEDGKKLGSSPYFPFIALDSADSEDGRAFVAYHPLVSRSIEGLDFRQINYDFLAQARSSIAIWLQRRIVHRYTQAGLDNDGYTINATTIIADSGLCNCKTRRDNFRAVRIAIQELQTIGFIKNFTAVDRKVGRQVVDIQFTLRPSPKTIGDQIRANIQANRRDELAEGMKADKASVLPPENE